jgi:hypothetical protein
LAVAEQYDQRKYIKVDTLEDLAEKSIVEQVLSDSGLSFYIKKIDDSCYSGVYQLIYGYAELWAPREEQAEIEQLLAEIRQQSIIFDEDV